MLQYIDTSEIWKGEAINGIRHPLDIEAKWTTEELVAIGLKKYVAPPKPKPPVTPEVVKAEAFRRIENQYPLWKQANIIRQGGEALSDMSAYIDGIRACSNTLENSLPEDYSSDHHWLIGG